MTWEEIAAEWRGRVIREAIEDALRLAGTSPHILRLRCARPEAKPETSLLVESQITGVARGAEESAEDRHSPRREGRMGDMVCCAESRTHQPYRHNHSPRIRDERAHISAPRADPERDSGPRKNDEIKIL